MKARMKDEGGRMNCFAPPGQLTLDALTLDAFCMEDWFSIIAADCELSANAIQSLNDVGFVVIPNLIAPNRLAQLSAAYDSAVASASSDDVVVGRTTTRVHDFVNRGSEFDELYVCQPLLKACCQVIGQPFKLSSMLARTLHPNAQAQGLHIDFKPDEERFPMVSFIWMVDEFRSDNGIAASCLDTCFAACLPPFP